MKNIEDRKNHHNTGDQKTNELTRCQKAHPRVASIGEVRTKSEIFSSRLKKSIIERKVFGLMDFKNKKLGQVLNAEY
uniref:Uncharacterized protein n=1 Tax=Romanomermis culicivorax TaxID=13658 RepID=A0A915I691_ROMCU